MMTALLLCATVLLPVAPASARLSDDDLKLYREAFRALDRGRWDEALTVSQQARDKLPGKVILWLYLSRTETSVNGASFEIINKFLKNNPDWPNLAALRRQAEQNIPDDMPMAAVRDWFKEQPPQSLAGFFRYMDALMAGDLLPKVQELVRQRWVESAFGPQEEQEFLGRFGAMLRPEEHAARLDRLLWDGQDVAARRLLPLLDNSNVWRVLADIRLAYAGDGRGVETLLERLPPEMQEHPGLLYDRLRWFRRKDQDAAAYAILQKNLPDLGRPVLWWNERHIMARRALRSGNPEFAYTLARDHRQTEGTGLNEAEFLAGWIALRFLKKPDLASEHFTRLGKGVTSPISKGRAAYWGARAAEARGDSEAARKLLEAAAEQSTSFYGQLAAARLGKVPKLPAAPEAGISDETKASFEKKDMVRIVRALAEIEGRGSERVTLFVRRLGATAAGGEHYALTAKLAQDVGRPDLAITVAKQANQAGIILAEGGYPLRDLGDLSQPEPALVLALIRQESTFNPNAVSPVGARGLMQLMPATAQTVAKRLGIKKHDHSRLTSDPEYNIRLGTTYMSEMLDRFNGSFVLAIAAYNAGIGRVRSWLETQGDPRAEGVDVVDWIEMIPIHETRNYVQRVMEGLMVYRARLNHGQMAGSLDKELKR